MGDICHTGSKIRGVLDGGSQEIDDLLSNEGAVHVEHHQAGVPAPEGIGSEGYVDVPFSLEAVDELVLAEVLQGKIVGSGRRGKGELDDGGMVFLVRLVDLQAAVRRVKVGRAGRERKGRHEVKEGGDTHRRDVGAVEVVEGLRLGGGRLEGKVVELAGGRHGRGEVRVGGADRGRLTAPLGRRIALR